MAHRSGVGLCSVPASCFHYGMTSPFDSGSFSNPHDWHKAFRTLRPVAEDMPEDRVRSPNIKVYSAVTHIIATSERAEAYRKEFEQLQPLFDMVHLDQLALRAMALQFAEIRVNMEGKAERQAPAVLERARTIRERLLRTANYLTAEGLLDGGPMESMRGNRSHAEVGADLLQLALMFNQAGARIAGMHPISQSDLHEAVEVGGNLTRAIAADHTEAGEETVSVDLRNRFFTLAMLSYAQIERALDFIRFDEGDAQNIAPNLVSASRRRPRSSKAGATPEPTPPS